MTATETKIINQARISDQVYDYLRGEIVAGRLAPGERVSPEEFAQQLKVSKMPIKEAIERLASEGLFEIQARRGTYVSRLNAEELAETFEVRCALEVLAGRKAAERITKTDIASLHELIAAMERSTGKHDVRKHLDQNAAFHELILRLSGNRKLLETWQRLRTPLHVAGIHHRTDDWTSRVAQEQREHRAIVRALERRDPDAVQQAITQHIMRAGETLSKDIEKIAG